MEIEFFKESCIKLNSDILVQKHIIEEGTYFFDEIRKGEEFEFKKDIATILNVHVRDIIVVGSGKLGFSLKPDNAEQGLYLFREFDYYYNKNNQKKKSDLDIAIISSYLFDREIQNLYNDTKFYRDSWDNRNAFGKYVLMGRIAIRFLPMECRLTKEIKEVQEKYKMKYGREINIEIYKSWHFFETYHQENIKHIKVNLLR